MRIFVSILILLGVVAGVGCQPAPSEVRPSVEPNQSPIATQPPESSPNVIDTPDRINENMKKTPERIPPKEETTPVTGEVPRELLDSILQALEKQTGIAPEMAAVVQAEAVIWNDGSLGCPQPGMMYTQALVNGYRVVLQVGDQKYDYHASDKGYFFLCEGGLQPLPPKATPNS